jgi:AcrR family transcriptional regulator
VAGREDHAVAEPSTREQILNAAELSVLAKGFGATSIDELIAEVGISKSGFFYHFRDKSALAKALLERYIAQEDALFDELFSRADELNEDPLHGFLVGLKMLAEMLADLPGLHPGCLVASVCYHEQLFHHDVAEVNQAAVLAWRTRFRAHFDRIAAVYPPGPGIDLDAMADMLSVIADGGIIVQRVLKEPAVLPQQILLYREFVRLAFAPQR